MLDLLREIVELPNPVLGCVAGHARWRHGTDWSLRYRDRGTEVHIRAHRSPPGASRVGNLADRPPQLTSRAVGRYFLTGEKFAPAEAERLGIVTVAAEERGSLRGAAGRAAPKLSAGTGRIQSANHRSGPG